MSAEVGSAFTLFIETGLHAGTVQRLAPGIYTLGSELDADIVLSDKDIEAIHLIVELDQRGLRLEPLQGNVAVHGEKAELEPGGERHLTCPAAFAIGDTSIRITAPKDVVQTHRRLRNAVFAASLVVLAIVGFQIVDPFADADHAAGPSTTMPSESAAVALVDGTAMRAASNVDPEAGRDESGVDAISIVVPEVTLDQAAAALRERLAADGLDDIEVKTAIDRILVRGEAEPARMGDWQDVRIWYDGAFGQDFLLVANVEPAESDPPPKLAIEAVWSGDDPYLIAGGQRFFVGAHVGDGWTIERIGSDEVTFKRGDESFSLTL